VTSKSRLDCGSQKKTREKNPNPTLNHTRQTYHAVPDWLTDGGIRSQDIAVCGITLHRPWRGFALSDCSSVTISDAAMCSVIYIILLSLLHHAGYNKTSHCRVSRVSMASNYAFHFHLAFNFRLCTFKMLQLLGDSVPQAPCQGFTPGPHC